MCAMAFGQPLSGFPCVSPGTSGSPTPAGIHRAGQRWLAVTHSDPELPSRRPSSFPPILPLHSFSPPKQQPHEPRQCSREVEPQSAAGQPGGRREEMAGDWAPERTFGIFTDLPSLLGWQLGFSWSFQGWPRLVWRRRGSRKMRQGC